MSLWPILQPRRRNDEHAPLTPIPEPLQAGESLSAAGSFEHTAALILRQTLEVTGAGSAVIFRLEPSAERLSSLVVLAGDQAITTPELSCTPGEGLAGRAAFERRVIWTGNALEDRQAGAYWKEYAALLGEGRRAAMAAPLSFCGELFGALQVGYVAMRTFRANELSVFGKLASFAATALENARLHDITVRGARQLRLLHDVAARLTVADDPAEIARRVVTAARDLVSARAGRLWLRNTASGSLELAAGLAGDAFGAPPIGWPLEQHQDLLAIRESGMTRGAARQPESPGPGITDAWRPRAVEGAAAWLRGVRCVPLTRDGQVDGVIGMASLLLDTDLSAEQRDTAETIQASAEALLSLVNDLLDFSKIEAGRMTLDPVDFSPRVVVDEVVDLLAEQAWSHGLDLTAMIDDDVPARAHADPSRLRQVLVNLVGNAIKFTEHGDVRVRVSRAVQDDDTMLRVDVADTGIGIAPDALLQQRGHHVESVVSGQFAVEAMERASYDLVLMDCQMPGMDGFAATEAIRRLEGERATDAALHPTPIVAVTASATSRDRERCLEAGMDDYISKPIDVVELDLVLGRWLSQTQPAAGA